MAASDTGTSLPSGLILCIDLGDRRDAALAIAALNGLRARGEANRIALGVARPSLEAAQLGDVIDQCYPSLPAGSRPVTVAMPGGTPVSVALPGLAALPSRKGADGTPIYPTRIRLAPTRKERVFSLYRALVSARPVVQQP
jgi:hypothetical protein